MNAPLVLTLDDVAAALQVSRRTINRLVKDGQIDSFKVGGQRRIRRTDLDTFIERGGKTEDSKAPDPTEVADSILEKRRTRKR